MKHATDELKGATSTQPPMEVKRKGFKGFIFKVRVFLANLIVKSLGLKVYSTSEIKESFSQLNQLRSYVACSGHLANHYEARQRIADHLNLAMGSLVSAEGRAGTNISYRHIFIARQYLMGLSKKGFRRAMRKKHLAEIEVLAEPEDGFTNKQVEDLHARSVDDRAVELMEAI